VRARTADLNRVNVDLKPDKQGKGGWIVRSEASNDGSVIGFLWPISGRAIKFRRKRPLSAGIAPATVAGLAPMRCLCSEAAWSVPQSLQLRMVCCAQQYAKALLFLIA
jgi:hypothetical protein